VFDDLKIRNKLILLVAGPIVIIVLLAALGARSRQATADDSRSVESLVSVSQANSNVVDALQQESLYSSAFVGADREAWQSQVLTTRRATDAALADALARLRAEQAHGTPAFRSAATLAIDAADKLTYIRKTVDQGYRFDQVASTYAALQDTFLATNATVTEAVTDPKVSVELRTGAALAAYKSALAQQASILVGAAEQGGFTADGSYDQLATAVNDANSQQAIFASIAPTARKGEVRDALTSDAHVGFETARDKAVDGGYQAKVTVDPKALTVSASAVLADLHKVETNLYRRVINTAQATRTAAERAANLFLVAAVLAIIAAAGAAILLGRRITKPLNELADAADHLAQDQMPRLVESLRNPSEEEVSFQIGAMQDIEIHSKDEIGRLASSFNDVQRVASEVAAEQAALLRKGIGDMFVNLARRNQALLDRQIEFIDELERGEEDPDALENLYRLDHLATRMRRNAESLLVLAGAEPPRRRGRPAPLANVVRAALAEVEDFGRIELMSFDEVLVASNAAADLAHLLSELMENAANFSPPETRVEVVGHRTKADGYVISVTDHGIGMSGEQIIDANESLATPPLVGLALSRSLGFIVVGRLAARHGIAVRMMPSPSGGVTAVVSLPPTLVTDAPGLSVTGRDQERSARLTTVSSPNGAPPVEAEVAPLEFVPMDLLPNGASRADDADLAPTGPVRHESSDTSGALPTRRLTAAPVQPERTATVSPITPNLAPPEAPEPAPVLRPVLAPRPEPESTVPAALLFSDPRPVPDGQPAPVDEHDGPAHLDGPPPAAPPMPSRVAPARPSRSDSAPPMPPSADRPFFLEEAAPPRLFGTGAKAPAAPEELPQVEAAPPAAAVTPPRLFGGGGSAEAPTAPVPPLARRTAPAAPAPAPAPAAPAPATPTPTVSVPASAAPSAEEPQRTTAGLAKRTPRAAGATRAIPGSDAERGASATRRSPDEVRNLLSRYRDGQQRARTEEPVPAGAAHERDTNE